MNITVQEKLFDTRYKQLCSFVIFSETVVSLKLKHLLMSILRYILVECEEFHFSVLSCNLHPISKVRPARQSTLN